MDIKKNDIIELEITGTSSDGSGVGRYGGVAVFVPSAAVGDVISCRIVKVNKNMCFGIIDGIITPSADRIPDPGCAAYPKCGGCVYRHISYEAELRTKDDAVRQAFRRIGGVYPEFDDILGGTSDRYRNKAEYPLTYIDGRAAAGFYASRSHRVVPCADCKLQPEIFSRITDDILRFVNENTIPLYDEKTGKGLLRHIYIRRGAHSGETMVCLVVTSQDESFSPLAAAMTEKYPEIKSFVLNINPKNTNVITGEKCITLAGNSTITDIMCGRKIILSPLSFYQVNTLQAEKLYAVAKGYALSGRTRINTLLDLYCGAGTIGLSFADVTDRLIGCEIIPQAVENARENARANGTDAEYYCGDAGKISQMLAESGTRPDVIVIDPPRKGCDAATLSAIAEMAPERVVMISCDPATAARDTAILTGYGYKAERARAVDMFPRTKHVECVVLLSREKP
ncbi:MAG: 23S rRNA (uracil(1939)-C(5))-methyltransferase RlmD [Oscillospiraceae bacterium]|nr:23S rRNA (uracil(1939)-C(5))-methyltransferase RlmD [Oscillospiraceae bacterium]